MSYEKEALSAYIGDSKKAQSFEKIFKKYDKNPKSFIFLWPAFLFGFWYLWYRRAFLEASIWFAVFFLIPIEPETKIIISTILGTVGIPMILYNRYKKTKKEIEARVKDKAARLELLKEKGGTRKAAIVIPSLIMVFFIFVFAQFSSLFMGMTNAKTPAEMTKVMITYTEKNVRTLESKEKNEIEKQLTQVFTEIKEKKISNEEAHEKMRIYINRLWFRAE
ncbi:MAG: DUF2628 domain-containing protein [Alphaproteobacteria bacterium]|nr:DUF2628 domain-containing protein [Alphaproteobacteria bacterium]MBN2779667.1 DUF2628 domain-containing protein [Alphaproteobacteria bacterium]